MYNMLSGYCSMNDIIAKPLVFASTIIIGVSSAVILVSLFVHRNNGNNDSSSNSSSDSESDSNFKAISDSESDTDFNKKYEEKYLEKYKKLENNDLVSDEIKFIEDLTPAGIVKLAYDKYNRHFIYYCNKKNIPYKYLETVSRLFVVEKDCKNICVRDVTNRRNNMLF